MPRHLTLRLLQFASFHSPTFALGSILLGVLTAGFLVGNSAFSKDLAQFGIQHYDQEQNLSTSTILEILQTQDGYLWVGTYDGLNRFNGVEFKVFYQNDTPNLPSDNITRLYQTRDGVFWVAMLGKGIQGFLDANLTQVQNGSRLPALHVTDLKEDNMGRLYAATREGLYRFEDEQWSLVDLEFQGKNPAIVAIAIDEEDRLYLATDSGICIWDGQHCAYLHPDIPEDISVRGFIYSKHQGLWFGTFKQGLFHFQDSKLEHYTSENGLLHNEIGDVTFDSSGNLWVGGREGISFFKNGHFTHNHLRGQMIYSLCHDTEGGMWAGTYLQGLYRFGDTTFSSYTNVDSKEESIVGRAITELDSRMLIGTNMGIYELRDGYLEKSKEYDELAGVMIRALKPASDGGVWVATHTDGIAKLHANGEVDFIGIEEGLTSVKNRCILESRDGKLWIAGDVGLQYIQDGNIHDYKEIQGRPILSLHELRDGTIAVATDDDGLYLIHPDSLEHFGTEDGMNSNIIFYVFEDDEGGLWVTMSDSGIAYIRNGELRMLRAEDGIPHDSVFYIVDDHKGFLWMASNSGIYSIEKAPLFQEVREGSKITPIMTRYDRTDGITSGGVTSISHPYTSKSGEIWFPTSQGVVSVDPQRLEGFPVPPRTVIESFATETQNFDLLKDTTIEIPAGAKRFTFKYSGLSMKSGKKTHFRVFLEGYDKDYVEVEDHREFAYTNLPPGTYTFHVNAATPNGKWSGHYASITFTLKPHIWETLLFQVILMVTSILLVLLFIGVRLKEIRKRHELLEKTVDERTSQLQKAVTEAKAANESKSYFLASVSHEIRNPMNGVIGIAELLKGTHLSETQKEYVDLIHTSSQTLLTILNDLLDYSRMDLNKLQLESIPFSIRQLIDETVALQQLKIQEKSLTIRAMIDPDLDQFVIGDPLRHRQVLHNLISNAVKFTEQGSIEIRVAPLPASPDSQHMDISFSVSDSGIGISPEQQKTPVPGICTGRRFHG